MAQIRPFPGIQYDLSKVGTDLSQLVTQPYDKISPDSQKTYYARSPYNIIRIEKNQAEADSNPYITAKKYLQKWRNEGVLKQAEAPAFYYLEQTFPFMGTTATRKALIGMGRLCDYKEGVIFPHEQTLKGPKVDRLELIRATKINLGQIFMLYEDPLHKVQSVIDKDIAGKEPWSRFVDDEGITQTIYIISDTNAATQISELMNDKQLFIADGHHRYETALAYSQEEADRTGDHDPNAWFRFAMMSMVNIHDPGLRILPTHRILNHNVPVSFDSLMAALKEDFTATTVTVPAGVDAAHAAIKALPANSLYFIHHEQPTKLIQLTLKGTPYAKDVPASLTRLDVYMLHEAILAKRLNITKEDLVNNTRLTYKRDPFGSIAEVTSGKQQMAFLLAPTDVADVLAVARDRQTMPQKSTDFFPKFLTGYVLADVRSAKLESKT